MPKESEIKTDKVNIDNETAEMLKKRFGDDFYTRVAENLDVKATEVAKREHRGKRRQGDNKREGRGPRQPRERGERPERKDAPKKDDGEEKPQDAAQEPKREGRRRGRGEQREGQD